MKLLQSFRTTMYQTSCVVNVSRKDFKNHKSTCCGIVLDSSCGLILTHGTILAPFLEHIGNNDSSFSNICTSLSFDGFECEVLLERFSKADEVTVCSKRESTYKLQLSLSGATSADPAHLRAAGNNFLEDTHFLTYTKHLATIKDVFQCSTFADVVNRLMTESSSWELFDRISQKHIVDENTTQMISETDAFRVLSIFVLLKVKDWVSYRSTLKIRPAKHCKAGEKVQICSTPFAGLKPEAFLNSYSQGIISNLCGEDNCFILTDARCILGGEGAPLYTYQHGDRCLSAIVVASLCWKNNEWIGFSVACSIDKVLESLHVQVPSFGLTIKSVIIPVKEHSKLPPAFAGKLKQSPDVVLIRVGQTWGSGVVIDKAQGLILTCSHVVKDAYKYSVETKTVFQTGLLKTKVIYRQHPLKHQFDLAVLWCTEAADKKTRGKTSVQIAKPIEGLEVYVIGYALFAVEHDLCPSITSGIISKVICHKNIPIMVQTTCAVHPGASGGALVDSKGNLVGIVVCNVRDSTNSASFPHVNMSIPVITIWPLITKFQMTRDVKDFEKLELRNQLIDRIWSLGQLTSVYGEKKIVASKL